MKRIILFLLLALSFTIYPQAQYYPVDATTLSSINFYNQYGVSGGSKFNTSTSVTLGRIFYTSNGTSWTSAAIPADIKQVKDIQLINNLTGFAVADNLSSISVLLKTTDAGATWNNMGTLPLGITIKNIYFFNDNNGLLCADSSGTACIYKTINSGNSWTRKYSSSNSTFSNGSTQNGFVFVNSNTGFAVLRVGNTGNILKTTNAGDLWQISYTDNSRLIYGFSYFDDNTYFFTSINYPIVNMNEVMHAFKSTNGGMNWNEMTIPWSTLQGLPNPIPERINFYPGGNIGFILIDGFDWSRYFKTTDKGVTWNAAGSLGMNSGWNSTFLTSGNKWFLTIGNLMGTNIYMVDGITPVELTSFTASVTSGNVILNWSTATETNNKGFEIERKSDASAYTTVAFIPGYGTSTEKHNYSFSDNSSLSGKYTYRLKQLDYDGKYEYSKEVEVNISSITSYSLEQNFPNPFNPTTKIVFSLADNSVVSLKVFDMLGRQVAQPEYSMMTKGTHEVSFDASNLPSGLYIYTLKAGNFTASKKMMVMK